MKNFLAIALCFALSVQARVSADLFQTSLLLSAEQRAVVTRLFAKEYPAQHQQEMAAQRDLSSFFIPQGIGAVTIFGATCFPTVKDTADPTLIAQLTQDTKFMKKVERLLKNVKKCEGMVLSFWEEERFDKESVDSLYIEKSNRAFKKNFSPAWQQFYSFHDADPEFLTKDLPFVAGELFWNVCVGSKTFIFFHCPSPTRDRSPWKASKEFYELITYLHEKTSSLAVIIRTLDSLSRDLMTHPELGNLKHAYALDALQKNNCSKKMEQLVTLLRTDTFKHPLPHFFAPIGRVRTAYALMNEVKDEFVPLLMAIGELDAYIACAKAQSN